jgi:signal peptidase II
MLARSKKRVTVRVMEQAQHLGVSRAMRAPAEEQSTDIGLHTISARRIVWFCFLVIAGLSLDLWTKHAVFTSPGFFHGDEWWLWENHIGIQKSLNEGALFGMGQGKVWIFALFSIFAAVAIPAWLFKFRAAEDFWLTTILGVIMGGVIGNFYDRVGLPGMTWDQFNPHRAGETVHAVRDWILFQVNDQWVWPNFNIADSLLVVGALALFVRSFFITEALQAK